MSVGSNIIERDGTFFISFTCRKWLSLFEITNTYDSVYYWFDNLKSNGHKVIAYVIMPNHIHVIIEFINSDKSINTIIGNAKKCLAIDIIKKLQLDFKTEILLELSNALYLSQKSRQKKHSVFEKSFDCKEIINKEFFNQKLNYIHNNPCSGKWMLAEGPSHYLHSSAMYYITGVHSVYEVDDV